MSKINKDDTKLQIINDLKERHGELIGGKLLSKVLGFSSLDAMKRAIERGTLNIPTFFVEGRKGRFALTTDIADWLSECRFNPVNPVQEMPPQFKKTSKEQSFK